MGSVPSVWPVAVRVPARVQRERGQNNYNCIPSIPIDRCDSFDVVFGVFLVQDLALFCPLFLLALAFALCFLP